MLKVLSVIQQSFSAHQAGVFISHVLTPTPVSPFGARVKEINWNFLEVPSVCHNAGGCPPGATPSCSIRQDAEACLHMHYQGQTWNVERHMDLLQIHGNGGKGSSEPKFACTLLLFLCRKLENLINIPASFTLTCSQKQKKKQIWTYWSCLILKALPKCYRWGRCVHFI